MKCSTMKKNKKSKEQQWRLFDFLLSSWMCSQKQHQYKPFFLTAYRVPEEEEKVVSINHKTAYAASEHIKTLNLHRRRERLSWQQT